MSVRKDSDMETYNAEGSYNWKHTTWSVLEIQTYWEEKMLQFTNNFAQSHIYPTVDGKAKKNGDHTDIISGYSENKKY